MRKCLCAGAVSALAMLVAACGGGSGQSSSAAGNRSAGSPKSYAELRWGMSVFPGPLEWKKNLFVQPASIDSLALQGLVEFNQSGKVVQSLARSVEHPNSTTYIYNLKAGVRFSDGMPLTVADVLYSLNRNISGKETIVKPYWEDVSSVTAHGAAAVEIKLKRPDVVWPEALAFTGTIIEKAAAERVGEKALGTPSGLPIGTGPWKIDSYRPEVSVTLSRNPYWSGPPQPASKITVSLFKQESAMALALRSGAIDGGSFASTPKLFTNIPGIRRLTAPGASTTFLAMNTTVPPFSDVHVRRAIAYATDVGGMIKALFPAGGAKEDVTVAPNTSFASLGSASEVNEVLNSLPKYDYDLAAAKRELAKSAYPHGFMMPLQVFAGEPLTLGIAEILAADLAKIGISAKVDELQPDENAGLLAGKTRAWVMNYSGIYPDAESTFSLMLPSSQIDPPGSGLNSARFRNAEVDKLMSEQREAVNPAQRRRLIGKLLDIAGAEVPYRAMFTPQEFIGLSDKYVFPTFSPWTILYTPWALNVKLAE